MLISLEQQAAPFGAPILPMMAGILLGRSSGPCLQHCLLALGRDTQAGSSGLSLWPWALSPGSGQGFFCY